MDNRRIDLSLTGKPDFELAMKLAVIGRKAIGYRVHENHLIFYWAKSEKMTALPYGMEVDEVTNFAWGWLLKNKPSASRPDHDGDNEHGFRIYNESWGHVFGEWEAIIAITPIWAMYGK
jgi:hypothetical protein